MGQETGTRAADGAPTVGKVRVGIGWYLVGQEGRCDGGHKRDAYINGTKNSSISSTGRKWWKPSSSIAGACCR